MRIRPRPAAALLSLALLWGTSSYAGIRKPDAPSKPSSATATVDLGTIVGTLFSYFNDTFPANETPGLPGTANFDTTSALIRSGLNIAQLTGDTLRFDIPGDSCVFSAPDALVSPPGDPALAAVRADLVFRILPGPGNYRIAGAARSIGFSLESPARHQQVNGDLLQLPTNQAALAVSGDGSFWGQYMADPGLLSKGIHGPGNRWDAQVWNSCRADTAELNIFPVGLPVPTSTGLALGHYMTTIHESDPKYLTLGVDKFRCFVVDTSQAATSGPIENNVVCDGTVPAWLATVPQSRTGWDGSVTTREFTSIIPDGLLTPGSHVQYFYRKSLASDPLGAYAMTPDTNFITPQPNENDVGGSFDMHRWQQFSVLPDRWKGEKYGGAGKACLLYVDWCDRRGVEGRFVSILDTIGMTGTVKLGAHNGWHAPGTTSIVNLDVRTNPSVAVGLNAQPGFSWDMYGVKGGESPTMSAGQIGSRLANRSGMGYAAGRESRQGPTAEMLRTYYRMVAILTGDLSAEIFGPLADRSQDDISLLTNFLTSALSPLPPPELLVQGSGFVQSETASGAAHPAHTQFLRDRLGVMLGDPSYPVLSGNTNACVDLHTTTSLAFQHDIYGAPNPGGNSANDVLQRNPAMTEAVEGSYYEPIGPNTPYVAEVVWRGSALRNWTALTSGYDATSLDARYCNTDGGRHAYYYYMLNQVFPYCVPYLSIDVPNAGRRLADYLKIGSAVMRTSPSTVRLGVGHAGRIQVRIYDVVGRRVRTLADRVFAAGEHTLAWDGTDDAGTKLAHGVYFVRSSNEKGSGRIVVLSR